MLPLTKKTVITWLEPDSDAKYADGKLQRKAKVKEMILAGKTNQWSAMDLAPLKFERYWVDQAAAEEFVKFITDLSNTGALPPIVSAVIEDYATPA